MSGGWRKKIRCQPRHLRLLRAAFKPSRMRENTLKFVEGTPLRKYALLLLLGCTSTFGQSVDKGPKEVAVVELGASAGCDIRSGGSNVAPTAAVEVTPIETWLELEAGVTPIFSRHSAEWDVDLLFKKPWTLSKKEEFMAGGGPEWIHVRQGGVTTNSVAGEAVLDFMFCPRKNGVSAGISNRAANTDSDRPTSGRPKRRSTYRDPLAVFARVKAAVGA